MKEIYPMKKLITFLLVTAMLLSLAACGKKPASESDKKPADKPADITASPAEETTPTPTAAPTDAPLSFSPAEYTAEYWETKYPDYMLCPFTIEEDGVAYDYFWPMGYEGLDGYISTWINCPFNWNGWHRTVDGCIVNRDETLKVTDNWANGDESMSSCCTITTEQYDKDAFTPDTGNERVISNYQYNAPKDNYYVAYMTYDDGTAYQNAVTKKGNVFTTASEADDRQVRYDYNASTAYMDNWNGTEGWTENSEEFSYADSYEAMGVNEFGSFEEYFMSYFNAYGFTMDKLEEYCVGTEIVAERGCWIIEDKSGSFVGFDARFWVDMETGICLKSTGSNGCVDYEVTELNLKY